MSIRSEKRRHTHRRTPVRLQASPVLFRTTPTNSALFFISTNIRTSSFTNDRHVPIAKGALVRTHGRCLPLHISPSATAPALPVNFHSFSPSFLPPSLLPLFLFRRLGPQNHHPTRPVSNRRCRPPRCGPPPSPLPRELHPFPLRYYSHCCRQQHPPLPPPY